MGKKSTSFIYRDFPALCTLENIFLHNQFIVRVSSGLILSKSAFGDLLRKNVSLFSRVHSPSPRFHPPPPPQYAHFRYKYTVNIYLSQKVYSCLCLFKMCVNYKCQSLSYLNVVGKCPVVGNKECAGRGVSNS